MLVEYAIIQSRFEYQVNASFAMYSVVLVVLYSAYIEGRSIVRSIRPDQVEADVCLLIHALNQSVNMVVGHKSGVSSAGVV